MRTSRRSRWRRRWWRAQTHGRDTLETSRHYANRKRHFEFIVARLFTVDHSFTSIKRKTRIPLSQLTRSLLHLHGERFSSIFVYSFILRRPKLVDLLLVVRVDIPPFLQIPEMVIVLYFSLTRTLTRFLSHSLSLFLELFRYASNFTALFRNRAGNEKINFRNASKASILSYIYMIIDCRSLQRFVRNFLLFSFFFRFWGRFFYLYSNSFTKQDFSV